MTTMSPAFSNLTVTDADVPKSRTALADNPFYAHLKASADNRTALADGKWTGQGKQTRFPAENAARAEQLIRQAAEGLKVGSAVRLRTPAGKPVEIESVGAKVTPSKKPGGKARKSGGTATPMVDGKKYTGEVVCYFNAKSPRDTKKVKAGTPAAPAPTVPTAETTAAVLGDKPAAPSA